MRPQYEKIDIKSESDLPKEDGDYIVHQKSFNWVGLANWKNFENANYPEYNQYLWLLNYDWYLQPLSPAQSIEPISDEEIENESIIYEHNRKYLSSPTTAFTCFSDGAKWYRSRLQSSKDKSSMTFERRKLDPQSTQIGKEPQYITNARKSEKEVQPVSTEEWLTSKIANNLNSEAWEVIMTGFPRVLLELEDWLEDFAALKGK